MYPPDGVRVAFGSRPLSPVDAGSPCTRDVAAPPLQSSGKFLPYSHGESERLIFLLFVFDISSPGEEERP